eukprot:scaffold108097_cov25-Tisochrysis_lutea.AAC.1
MPMPLNRRVHGFVVALAHHLCNADATRQKDCMTLLLLLLTICAMPMPLWPQPGLHGQKDCMTLLLLLLTICATPMPLGKRTATR